MNLMQIQCWLHSLLKVPCQPKRIVLCTKCDACARFVVLLRFVHTNSIESMKVVLVECLHCASGVTHLEVSFVPLTCLVATTHICFFFSFFFFLSIFSMALDVAHAFFLGCRSYAVCRYVCATADAIFSFFCCLCCWLSQLI